MLGTEHNRSLCFYTSVLICIACKPSILGILEPKRSLLPAHQKEDVTYGSAEKHHMRNHLHSPQSHPNTILRAENSCFV